MNLNENELADKRRAITRRILELQLLVSRSKKDYFNGGQETPMSVRTTWGCEIAELELARHDVEILQAACLRSKKENRVNNLHHTLIRVLQANKLDRYVQEAIKQCDHEVMS